MAIWFGAGCAGATTPTDPAPEPTAMPFGVDHGTLVLSDAPLEGPLTLVGPEGACEAQLLERTAEGLRVVASCDPVVALSGAHPDARLAPLRFEALPNGRGRVGTSPPWTVRLEYGPIEDGCPGLPGHAQVKLGAEPLLRQNTWLRVDRMHVLTTGQRAWLLLLSAGQGEAIALDGSAETVRWSYPSGADAQPACDEVDSASP